MRNNESFSPQIISNIQYVQDMLFIAKGFTTKLSLWEFFNSIIYKTFPIQNFFTYMVCPFDTQGCFGNYYLIFPKVWSKITNFSRGNLCYLVCDSEFTVIMLFNNWLLINTIIYVDNFTALYPLRRNW